MSYNYFEGLNDVHQELYNRKLCASGLQMCPYKVHADTWINDPMKWPVVEYGDIYYYLIENPKLFSREKMKNYRSLDAHNYFKDGWVQTAGFKSETILARNLVKFYFLNVNVMLGETCSHVAALLFKIEAAVRLGFSTSSCTSVACCWNATYTKKVSAARVRGIEFFKENYGEKSAKKPKIVPTISQSELETFLVGLKSVCPKSVLLSAYENHCDTFIDKLDDVVDSFPVDLRSYYVENLTDSDLTEKSAELLEKIYDITKSQCDNVQKATEGQSSSSQWFRFRAGRITSSTSHNLLRTSLDNPSSSAILTITKLGSRSFGGTAIQHGIEFEPKAVNDKTNNVDLIVIYFHNDNNVRQTM
ncbi:hypothetical protein KUTeg_022400 [Tegillarca granosa]|uniref:Uncharacterized protein n=1 Tax=Tegillarca granosa TaxID=220873 RepID=A0ABQ9EAP4_TEGGR|nr:hypothetical protein KUTeg_022400 [Tegillarca granosa]